MPKIKLKSCPFCGGKAKLTNMQVAEDCVETWVGCTDCFCQTDLRCYS
jgi:Restriction alleviation protein Lar